MQATRGEWMKRDDEYVGRRSKEAEPNSPVPRPTPAENDCTLMNDETGRRTGWAK